MNETNKKELRKALNELYEILKESGAPSVIYLPFINHFSVTGKVGGHIICIGLLLAQISDATGKPVKDILDKDFYKHILPECMKIIKEGEEV